MASVPTPTTSTKDSVHVRPPEQKSAATQRFLPIGEIHDNTVVLKNGGLRAVLKTTSINFNLKSEEEQNAILSGYQSFLNSLEFPLQIIVRSKKLDIDDYLANLKELQEHQQNQLLKQQTIEYHEYIEKLIEYADIMEKNFYVVVPMDPASGPGIGFIDRFLNHLFPDDKAVKARLRRKTFREMRKKLGQRVNQVEQGLMNLNLRTQELTTKELIELYYQSYNPITARHEKITDLDKLELDHEEL